MRRGPILVALVAAATLALAAADKPNLSGRWQLADQYLDIDHRDPILIIQSGGTTRFLATDGVARTDTTRTVTRWDGQALEVRTTTEPAGVERLELSANGTRLAVTAGGTTSTWQRADLRAGVASVDVTPSAFLPMYGYANRKCGPANGVHDPLMAKVVVLESGPVRVAIVAMDLGSFVSSRLVTELRQTFGLDAVLLSATHTHSAPQFVPSSSAPTPQRGAMSDGGAVYLAELERKITDAVRRASAAMFRARLHTGRGEIALGYNRLLPREHGRSRALFDNLERRPLGPLDSEFQVLEVRDEADTPRAVLVHYGVHSVVLGPTNCKYSADYPGAMQAAIEKAIPGVQAMFIQGGAGDVNPIFQGRTGREEEDFALVARMGDLLAAEVLKSRATLRAIPAPSLPIRARSDLLTFADRWDSTRRHELGIATVSIGREIAIATPPGEPLHRLQTRWKQEADAAFPLLYGYTYAAGGVWAGYLPDIRSAAQGGYGADSTSTRVEVGAGERLIERHLVHLYDLLGMWRAAPGPSS
jgi:hypothetical protein